jgi:outer membrane lipoprotein-sorting protein
MKRLPLIVLTLVLLSLLAVAGVFAQGSETVLDESNASLSIVQTVPVTASVEVNINGQIHLLAVPVLLNIDAQQNLADALLTAQTIDVVGDVQWVITGITEYDEEYDLSQFSTLEPSSPDNKLVVFESNLTNLGSEPFVYWTDSTDRYAYDDLGNLYESIDESCDDINPGSTQLCTFVFDVSDSATLLGLDVKVYDHKRVPFNTQE